MNGWVSGTDLDANRPYCLLPNCSGVLLGRHAAAAPGAVYNISTIDLPREWHASEYMGVRYGRWNGGRGVRMGWLTCARLHVGRGGGDGGGSGGACGD
jgi:hypothetical protein